MIIMIFTRYDSRVGVVGFGEERSEIKSANAEYPCFMAPYYVIT